MRKHIAFAFFVALFIAMAGCGQEPAVVPPANQAPPAITAPDESAAVAALEAIVEAQGGYFQRNRRYALDYKELVTSRFLREEPTDANTGYEIIMRPSPDAARFTLSATPLSPSPTARHLFTDQTGVIHAEQGQAASADSPRI